MAQLNLYPLPYTASRPPSELFRDVETESGRSTTTAFNAGLDDRDVFLGQRACVVCGETCPYMLERCHIVGPSDVEVWNLLKRLGWAPAGVKGFPTHETRNGLTLCLNHQTSFETWDFFIRFQPATQKYILVVYDSYDVARSLQPFHGKAVALDINHERAPLPLLFFVHEYMARGRNFYRRIPDVEVTNGWQDWMVDKGVVNEKPDGTFTFKRDGPTSHAPAAITRQASCSQASFTTAGPSGTIMPPTADLVEELMSNQRTTPSWKAWLREAMGWEGTADQNTKKYVENIGVESGE